MCGPHPSLDIKIYFLKMQKKLQLKFSSSVQIILNFAFDKFNTFFKLDSNDVIAYIRRFVKTTYLLQWNGDMRDDCHSINKSFFITLNMPDAHSRTLPLKSFCIRHSLGPTYFRICLNINNKLYWQILIRIYNVNQFHLLIVNFKFIKSWFCSQSLIVA